MVPNNLRPPVSSGSRGRGKESRWGWRSGQGGKGMGSTCRPVPLFIPAASSAFRDPCTAPAEALPPLRSSWGALPLHLPTQRSSEPREAWGQVLLGSWPLWASSSVE